VKRGPRKSGKGTDLKSLDKTGGIRSKTKKQKWPTIPDMVAGVYLPIRGKKIMKEAPR